MESATSLIRHECSLCSFLWAISHYVYLQKICKVIWWQKDIEIYSAFEPDTLLLFSGRRNVSSQPLMGFWWHMQKWLLIYPTGWGCSRKYLGTQYSELLWHSPCRVKPTPKRSSWKIELCLWIYTIYPLLQSQSSSGSVGKSIWPAFWRSRFKSWLDLNVFFYLQEFRDEASSDHLVAVLRFKPH